MYYLVGETSFIKKFNTHQEAKDMANSLTIKDISYNCYISDYRVLKREDLEQEIMKEFNISLENGLYLGQRDDLRNFFNFIDKI